MVCVRLIAVTPRSGYVVFPLWDWRAPELIMKVLCIGLLYASRSKQNSACLTIDPRFSILFYTLSYGYDWMKS